MKPEPTEKLDAATTVAVNGPEDDSAPLRMDRTAPRHRTPRACSSRMLGDWQVPFLGGPAVVRRRAYPTFRSPGTKFPNCTARPQRQGVSNRLCIGSWRILHAEVPALLSAPKGGRAVGAAELGGYLCTVIVLRQGWKLGDVARARALACRYLQVRERLSPPVVVEPKTTSAGSQARAISFGCRVPGAPSERPLRRHRTSPD
jgi:hypothetical protein